MGVLISVEIDRAILTALKGLKPNQPLEINYGNGSERIYVTANTKGYAVRKDSDFEDDPVSMSRTGSELSNKNCQNPDSALKVISELIPKNSHAKIKIEGPEKSQPGVVFPSNSRTAGHPAPPVLSSPQATYDSFSAVLADTIKAAIKGIGYKSGFAASCVTCISGLTAVKAANPERLQTALKSALLAVIPQDPTRQQAILDGVLEQLKSKPEAERSMPARKEKPKL